jgi:cytochrome P450
MPWARQSQILEFFHALHQRHGPTYVAAPWIGRTNIHSTAAANVQCMMSDRIDDWAVQEARQAAVGPLFGRGIFTTDGPSWRHSRALMRPQFERAQVLRQTEHFEAHIGALVAEIPEGVVVDLQGLFHRFTMDTSSEFLTGASTGSLGGGARGAGSREFIECLDYAMEDAAWRARLGWWYHLRPDRRAWRSIRYSRDYVKVNDDDGML